MTKGYSKLLIHDLILPDRHVPTFAGLMDLIMVVFNCGMERSRAQWTKLLADAGFRVVKFWINVEDLGGIVEAVLMDDL